MQQTPDYSQLLKLAHSNTGQQLMALLQKSGADALSSAASKASNGDYTQAQSLLNQLLQDPKARALLKQLEEQL